MDIANALFNWVAALFVILNAYDIFRQKSVAGHTYPSAIFFAVWAFFSIFYFYGLGQWWTFYANLAMAVANGALLVLVFIYRPRKRDDGYEPMEHM
jgi:glucose dehydrogenase